MARNLMRHRLAQVGKHSAVVIGSVGTSTFLALALRPFFHGQSHFLPFTLAIIVSAWYGGMIPGLSATALSFLVADFLFIEPIYHFLPLGGPPLAALGLFLVVGVSISVLHRALAKANAKLRFAVERLDETAHRFELASQQAKIGFHEYLAESPGCRQRQIWTPEMEWLFGLAPGTFEGSHDDWLKRIHPGDRERIAAERAHHVERRLSDWKSEYRAILPDGKIRWMESRNRLFFSKSGILKRILGATIDVTERRELEESLRERSEQLARSNEQLERFAYSVSHDLQEPLRGVTAMTELFLSRVQGTLDEKSHKLLELVLSSADRMKRLIYDILQLARVSGDPMHAMARVEARVAVEAAIQDLREAIAESGARVHFDPLPAVCAHEGQLTQLFGNLIGNAIRYRGESPPVIHISVSNRGQEWLFCVEDNGMGIDSQHQKHVFEMFFRSHGRADRQGTGLGLAICERIVQRHNGRIWVESEVGRGSRFYFTLPAGAQSGREEQPNGVSHEPVQGEPSGDHSPVAVG
ncbi:MAG TPA: ATP-binding protein [Bryobacteraceae bacterium]